MRRASSRVDCAVVIVPVSIEDETEIPTLDKFLCWGR
jgi:hypothetical protein